MTMSTSYIRKVVNETLDEIDRLRTSVAELEAERKAENQTNWEPKIGEYYINSEGDIDSMHALKEEVKRELANYGNSFEFVDEAEKEQVRRRKQNRLAAWVREHALNWSPQYDGDTFLMIIKDHGTNKYITSQYGFSEHIGPCPPSLSEKLIEALNSGEVKL